jgi:hypothetical protein
MEEALMAAGAMAETGAAEAIDFASVRLYCNQYMPAQ